MRARVASAWVVTAVVVAAWVAAAGDGPIGTPDPTPTPTATGTATATPTPEPGVANMWVVDGTDGSTCDSTPTASTPAVLFASAALSAKACTFRQAYENVDDGNMGDVEIVRVRPGTYPGQYFGGVRDVDTGNNTPAAHDEPVTFIGDEDCPRTNIATSCDVVVYQLHFGGNDVTMDGVDVDTEGEYPGPGGASMEADGESRDITILNSRVGNVDCQKALTIGGDIGSPQPETIGLVLDNIVFHDVTNDTDPEACHNECIKSEAQGLTLRNSIFVNCATMSLSLGYGNHYGMTPVGDITIVNNVFGHNTDDDGWHGGPNLAWFAGEVVNVYMVNNTFERGVGMDVPTHTGAGPYSGVIANNVGGGWECLTGVTYAGNVGTDCGGSDVEVTPYESTVSVEAPFGWVDPATNDFELDTGSPAISAASATYAPATDRLGRERCGTPDAGALEYQGDC